MKTKILLFSLFAGAFLCFSNTSYAQHSSDGINGQNMIDVGIGFGGGLASYSFVAGGTGSVTPEIVGRFDHGISANWTIGGMIAYQSYSYSDAFQDYNSNYVLNNYTEKWSFTAISVLVRGAYHFTVSNSKFDPYVGIGLGYNSFSSTYTNTDPNYGTAGYGFATPTYNLGGVAYAAFVGARYYFSDHIGAWGELGYAGWAGDLLNLGITFKL